MASAGLMRAALSHAHWWVNHRAAFQRRLIDQPLMRAVIADLTLETEAALALAMGAAKAYDGTSEPDRAFARISVALAKFMSKKRAPVMIVEAMECLGGLESSLSSAHDAFGAYCAQSASYLAALKKL